MKYTGRNEDVRVPVWDTLPTFCYIWKVELKIEKEIYYMLAFL